MDNKGAGFVLAKLCTSSSPGASILRQLALLLAERDTSASVNSKSRRFNSWADALSKGNYDGFDASKRVRARESLFHNVQNDFMRYMVV